MALRDDRTFWIRLEGNHKKEVDVSGLLWRKGDNEKGYFLGVVGVGQEEIGLEVEENRQLAEAAKDIRRRRWKAWLKSEMYGTIVQARLDELDNGVFGAKGMDLGRSKRKIVERAMRK